MEETTNLTGKTLIAMPDMGDSRFDRSVILLCAHSDEGAMGLMVNVLSDGITLSHLAEQLDIDRIGGFQNRPVHTGGPVEQERGFVLHTTDYTSSLSTLEVTDQIAMTGTLDIIEDLVEGTGPDVALICLGYCGWGPGQLESEIAQNAWLVGEAPLPLIFATPDPKKWEAALANEKISALTLSTTAGRA
ncbi:YqgE/AlgH family protein [Pseudooceanicola onchidii]|uniref:YqgE/AlgH family protein n=1 Tax=Pseudooceanicola onchidii TaxID=2562279 RepID=UPI001F0F2FAA|nr:YqgE/AlgH family protein [Pseudooceanicola onchidii]